MRAIAITLVVLSHAGFPCLSGGFIGVDVFFVLSGYLITRLLLREFEQSGSVDFMRFYANRLKRLLPALVVMLCTVFGAALVLLSRAEAAVQLASAPFAASWTSNIYFAFASFEYFNELTAHDLFVHSWSLGVEEQFYLLWPGLLMGLCRLHKLRRPIGFHGTNSLLPSLLLVSSVSLAISIYWTYALPHHAFYQMPSRIWQFALGGMASIASRRNVSRWPSSIREAYFHLGILATGLLLIMISALWLHPNLPYPGMWASAPSMGAFLVISAGSRLPSGGNPLAHPAMVWLGDRSYSLYLWHWPVLVLGFSLGAKDRAFPVIGLVMLSLLAAGFSYRFIELPFWKGRFSQNPSRHMLLLGLSGMAITLAALDAGLYHLSDLKSPEDRSARWRQDIPAIYSMGCDKWYTSDKVEPCVFGEKSAPRTVVLLGDSIMAQWFSAIRGIFPEPEWRTVVLTKSSCAMVDEEYYYPRIGQIYHVCTNWRNAVLNELDTLKPDVLIIGSAATYAFGGSSWKEGSIRILERVSKVSGTVFIVPGTPALDFDGPGCLDRNLTPDGHIDRDTCLSKNRLKNIEQVAHHLKDATEGFPAVHFLDLNDLVCPEGNCNAMSADGVVVFRDSQHLTDSFVRSRIPSIRRRMNLAGRG